MNQNLQKLQDKLFLLTEQETMTSEERKILHKFIDDIVEKLTPTYMSLEEIKKDKKKRKTILEKFKKLNEALDGKRNT